MSVVAVEACAHTGVRRPKPVRVEENASILDLVMKQAKQKRK